MINILGTTFADYITSKLVIMWKEYSQKQLTLHISYALHSFPPFDLLKNLRGGNAPITLPYVVHLNWVKTLLTESLILM